jgi:hypothetical protein
VLESDQMGSCTLSTKILVDKNRQRFHGLVPGLQIELSYQSSKAKGPVEAAASWCQKKNMVAEVKHTKCELPIQFPSGSRNQGLPLVS